jgi:hypothetical protein
MGPIALSEEGVQGMGAKEAKKAIEIVMEYQSQFLEKWEEYHKLVTSQTATAEVSRTKISFRISSNWTTARFGSV